MEEQSIYNILSVVHHVFDFVKNMKRDYRNIYVGILK